MSQAALKLDLKGLRLRNPGGGDEPAYSLAQITHRMWDWDKVVKGSHLANCWYNRNCLFNIYVKDGVVLREEQAGSYPPYSDPEVPDMNPKGCAMGCGYSDRMYDPTRIKYPLKRVGARGEGKWQRISWDEALTEIADTFLDVLLTEGIESVIAFRGSENLGTDSMAWGAWRDALGLAGFSVVGDMGDEHPGLSLTIGKIGVSDAAADWFYSDMIFLWGANPAYTHMSAFHYIPESRYNGVKVVAITPDYNASVPAADLWVPIRIGTDAALALAMCQVVVSKGLYKTDFIREQTDLPLLVRMDNRKFLRETDRKRDGLESKLYVFDQKSRKVVEAPFKTLALDGIVPALEGEYEVDTLRGKVKVKPVFELLKAKLQDYTPQKASQITGVSAKLIEDLAVEFAKARGAVNVSTAGWGKFYHGDLIQRAQVLLWALGGHFGKKGASYNGGPLLAPDTSVGTVLTKLDEVFRAAKGVDPRFLTWQEQGYTDEMILFEYMSQQHLTSICTLSTFLNEHAGLLDIARKHNNWDPDLKRPVQDYWDEALKKGWQLSVPGKGKEPRIIIERGGNLLKRGRSTNEIIKNLLPKLKLLLTVDIRMCGSALYSDIVLPSAGWYEKYECGGAAMPSCPYMHFTVKAVEPLYESKTDHEIFLLLAKKMQERAKARGVLKYVDAKGKERRLDNLYDQVSMRGLYTEKDDEAIVRDFLANAANLEQMEWEDLKKKGMAAFTGVGGMVPDAACEVNTSEPMVPLTYHTAKKQIYPTFTRRMQFYIDHDWFLELGEELPVHKDIPKMGGDYPLMLTSGHARWSIHSCNKDNPLLLRLQRGEPIMFVNAQDAKARGIADGDSVEVYNDIASFEIQAAAAAGVRPGQVVIYHDWENAQFKGKRHYKSAMASIWKPTDIAGGYGHLKPRQMQYHSQPGSSDRGTRVQVRQVGSKPSGA